MVDATKVVGKVEPADTQKLVLPLGFIDDGQKLEMVLSVTWNTVGKHFLHTCISRYLLVSM